MTSADTVPQSRVPATMQFLISASLFLSYMLFALGWNAGNHYIASLGFSASRTALLTNAITIAQAAGSLVAADVLLRLGPRRAMAFGSLLIAFGGLMSLTTAYPLVFLIRFVLGLGGALVVVFMSGIVAKVLTGRPLQIANGVNSVAFNTGVAIAVTFAAQMRAHPAAAVALAAVASLVVLGVWLVVSRHVPQGDAAEVEAESDYTMRQGFTESFNWIFALAYTGLLSYYIVAFTFMDAGTVRWVIYAGVVGALLGTVAAARTPDTHKPTVVVVLGALQVVCAAAVLAFADSDLIALVAVALGLVIFFPMPFFVQLAFIRPGVTPRQIAVTFSIFWAVSYAGSVIFIQIFAFIADATGGLENGIPVSSAPLVFIVFVETTFLIGTAMLWRWFRKQWGEVAGATPSEVTA